MAKTKRPSDYARMAGAASSNEIVSYKPVKFLYIKNVFYENFKKELLQPKVFLYVASRDHHNAKDGFNFNQGDTICVKDEGTTRGFTGTMPWTSKDVKGDAASGAEYGSVTRMVKEGFVPLNFVTKKERENWTAEEVCEYIIKRECLKDKCFYSEIMRKLDPKLVAKQDFGTDVTIPTFVSYARSMMFADYLNAIENFFVNSNLKEKNLDGVFIWTDLFCANQPILTGEIEYKGKEEKFDLLTAGLYKAIAKFKHKMILFDSWNKPRALRRAWCIWEVYAVARSETQIQIAMTDNQRNLYLEALQDAEKFDEIMQSIVDFDAVNATCFNDADLKMIHAAINKYSSFSDVNEAILEQLRQWHINTARAYIRDKENSGASEAVEFVALLNNTANLLQSQGTYEEAEFYFREALRVGRKLFGPTHPEVAICLDNLASLLSIMGRNEDALKLYYEALHIEENLYGKEHPGYAQVLNNIANLLSDQGEFAAAKPLYEQSLNIRKKVLGHEHPHVAKSLNNLAQSLQDQGKLKEAEPLMREALEISKKTLGNDHPTVAIRLNNLAMLLKEMGRNDDALKLQYEALHIDAKSFGKEHPNYSRDLNNVAALLRAQGKFREAESLYRQAIEIDKTVFGEVHPKYATDLNNLAAVLQDQGKLEEAKRLYEESLKIRKKALGDEHPQVADSLNNIALLLWEQDNSSVEAAKLGKEALRISEKVLGKDHPSTVQCRRDWG